MEDGLGSVPAKTLASEVAPEMVSPTAKYAPKSNSAGKVSPTSICGKIVV